MIDQRTLDKFLKRIEVDIDRIASMWDHRLRINVRKDYPLLAEAIDKLVGNDLDE